MPSNSKSVLEDSGLVFPGQARATEPTTDEIPDINSLLANSGLEPTAPEEPEEDLDGELTPEEKARRAELKAGIRSGDVEVTGFYPTKEDDTWYERAAKETMNSLKAFTTGQSRTATVEFLDNLFALGEAGAKKFSEVIGQVPEDKKREFWDIYKDELDIRRAFQEVLSEDYPVLTGAGLLGGAVTLPGVAPKSSLATLTSAGVVEGALSGAGASEADLLQGEFKRAADDMLTGAAVGGAFGAGFYGLGRLLSGASKEVTRETVKKLDKALADDVRSVGLVDKARARYLANEPAEKVYEEVVGKVESFDLVQNFRKWIAKTPASQQRALLEGMDSDRLAMLRNAKSRQGQAVLSEMKSRKISAKNRDNYIAWREAQQQQLALGKFLIDPSLKVTRRMKDEEVLRRAGSMAAQNGPEFLKRSLKRQRMQTHSIDVLADLTGKDSPRFLAKSLSALTSKQGAFFADAKYVYRAIDRKFGTELELVVDQLSNQFNRYTLSMRAALKVRKEMNKALRKSGMEMEEFGKYLENPASAERLQGQQRQAFEQWRDGFEWLRKEANRLGMPIEELRNKKGEVVGYLPKRSKDPVEYIRAFQKRAQELRLDKLKARDWSRTFSNKSGGHNDYREFRRALEHLWGPLKSVDDIKAAVLRLEDAETVKNKIMTEASAAFARGKEDMPKWLRETNVSKLFEKWSHEVFRHIHMRDGLQAMRAQAKVVGRGDREAADYILTHVQDLAGIRPGTVSATMRAHMISRATKLDRLAEESRTAAGRGFYRSLKSIPDFMKMIHSQIYPNLLGLNIKATTRNMLQPFLMTATELSGVGHPLRLGGTAWAQGRVFQAQLAAVWDVVNRKNVRKMLEDRGLLPSHFSGEGVDAIRQGMADSVGARMSKAALDAQANVAMWAYVKSDMWNRVVTLKMAQGVAADLTKIIKKTPDAPVSDNVIKFAKSMSPAYKTRLRALMKNKAPAEQVEGLVADYLLSTTQFNYNRVAMSQFGRTWGTWFSMFSKWPLSTASQSVDLVKQHGPLAGGSKVLTKYLGPMLAMGTVGSLVMPDVYESDRARKLVGSRGLAAWAPGSSLTDAMDVSLPPALSAVGEAAGAATKIDPFEGDWGAAQRFMTKQLKTFVPGAGWYRFVFEDLPTVGTDQKPEDFWEGLDFYKKKL